MNERSLLIGLLAGGILLATACSNEAPEEHVLKAQTDALDKAADVNQMVQDQAEQQRKAIDEQSE